MSDAGLTVLSTSESPSCCDVTVTVDRDGGYLPNPAEFAVAAKQAASARSASAMSAHTAGKISLLGHTCVSVTFKIVSMSVLRSIGNIQGNSF